MPFLQIPGLWPPRQEFQEVRGGNLFGPAKPQVWNGRLAGGAKERFPRLPLQEQLHSNAEEAKGLLLVQRAARPPVFGRA